jgi:inner membrane protein
VCREVLAVQLDADRYVIRSGFHSTAPAWIPADRCARLSLSGTRTAPLVPVALRSTDEMAWVGEFSTAADLPATLARDYCAVDSLLQFARAPWMAPRGDGWLAGDLRYDREPELGIAEIDVGPSMDACPRSGAPWVPPRADLLVGR